MSSEKVILSEYHVNALIDDWDEVNIKHSKINEKFFDYLIKEITVLDFVEKVYIASNGLIRINIKDVTPKEGWTFHSDIALHPNTGSLCMMRNERQNIFKKYEDEVINFIIKKLES